MVDGSAAPAVPKLARRLPAFPAPPAAMTRTRRRTMAVSSKPASVTKPASEEPSGANTGVQSLSTCQASQQWLEALQQQCWSTAKAVLQADLMQEMDRCAAV